MPPASDLAVSSLPRSLDPAPSISLVVWSTAFKNCLVAAAAMTLFTAFAGHPLLVLLALPAGGWFATFLYTRARLPVTAGIGARIGAVTGLIGYVISITLMGARIVFQRTQFLDEMKRSIQDAIAKNPDPQAQQIAQKLLSPEGMAVLLTLSAVFLFFMFLVLCSVGGAIGGSLAKGRSSTTV